MRWAALLAAAVAFVAAPAEAQLPAPQAQAKPAYLSLAQLTRRYRLPQSRFATIEGTQVHYTDEGPRGAPVIVLIHGSSSSLRTWDGVVAQLRGRYRLIRWDEPGMGLSGPPPQSLYDRPLYPVIVMEGLLARLGVRRANIAGVSSGGAIAYFFAASHPDMVERLVLSNTPSGRADGKGPDGQMMAMSRDLVRELAASSRPGQRQSKVWRPLSYWQAYFRFWTGEPERMTPPLLRQYYDMNRRPPAPDRLAMVVALDDGAQVASALGVIRAPTLLLWGARDPMMPPAYARALAAMMPGAQVSQLLMPDVGHYPPLEVPRRFARAMASWIEDTAPQAPRAPAPADR